MASDGDSRQVGVNKVFIGAGCNRIVNNVSWGAWSLLVLKTLLPFFVPRFRLLSCCSAQILATLPGYKAFVNCTHWLHSNNFSFKAKHLERHYLLSGDVDGVISLWELSLVDKKFIHSCELKEHTDWIRSLDFSLPLYASDETSSLLLASSSQYKGIRIWKMALRDSLGSEEISSLASYIKGPIFSAGSSSYQISLESLLIVEWQPPQNSSVDGIECYQPLGIFVCIHGQGNDGMAT